LLACLFVFFDPYSLRRREPEGAQMNLAMCLSTVL